MILSHHVIEEFREEFILKVWREASAYEGKGGRGEHMVRPHKRFFHGWDQHSGGQEDHMLGIFAKFLPDAWDGWIMPGLTKLLQNTQICSYAY